MGFSQGRRALFGAMGAGLGGLALGRSDWTGGSGRAEGSGLAGSGLAGSEPAGGSASGPTGVAAAAAGGYPYWVGPPDSGAPFVIDSAAGAQVAINAALKAAGQGTVFVAGGTYPVKAPIVLGDHQALVGAGPLSTLLKAVSGYAGGAMVTTPSGSFTGSRMLIADLGLEAGGLAPNGVSLQISAAPSSYGPDPNPWIHRVFVSNTSGSGIVLGGAYAGGQREFKLADCRVEHAGGWAYDLQSSDGFVSGCSAQGGLSGGYNLAAGNIKMWGCKAYSTGHGETPGPAFRIGAARATVTGCEAQDTLGCGFEVTGKGCTVSGCTADSTGVGTAGTDRYSAGFYVGSSVVRVTGAAYQRPGGGGTWIGAAGMRWALVLASGLSRLSVDLVSDGGQIGQGPFQGGVQGSATNSTISVLL